MYEMLGRMQQKLYAGVRTTACIGWTTYVLKNYFKRE